MLLGGVAKLQRYQYMDVFRCHLLIFQLLAQAVLVQTEGQQVSAPTAYCMHIHCVAGECRAIERAACA